ncbi:uncharacterized protein LOC101236927 isoform X1 [Hydra vulgaris]|uniref:uncharacterized protein LOC101236927 isoform X1 n=1 Tax=Hydra vulgaris TaxID=6087 RepID=UPI001F5E6C00|nr:uncharacterized protein LOC101236927 [Hydra vulgaris]
MSIEKLGAQSSAAVSSVIIPTFLNSDSESENECGDVYEELVFHPVLNKDIKTPEETKEYNFNTNKDSGILVDSCYKFNEEPDWNIQDDYQKSHFFSNNGILINDCYEFDEENEALSTQTSKSFDSSICGDISSIYGNLNFKDCLKNSDIPTESELDKIIEQLPNSYKKNESLFDDSDNLYESNSSASSLLEKLESTMVQLKKENNNKLEFLGAAENFFTIESDFLQAIPQEKKINLTVMARYGNNCSTNTDDLDDDEDIEKMRQELKQKSQSIINLGKKHESQIPCSYIEESQHLKIESESEIDFRNRIRVSEREFMLGDVAHSLVEKKQDVNMINTVDSMLDEVNRIMCGFDDHVFLNNHSTPHCDDKNSQFKNTHKDISSNEYICDIVSKKTADSNNVNEKSKNNVVNNNNNEYKFRQHKMCSPIIEIKDNDEDGNQKVSQSVHPVFDSCSYIDYDMKTEVIDWCNILDKDSFSEKKNASPLKSVYNEVFDSLFTKSFFSAEGSLKNLKHEENKIMTKPKTSILSKKNKDTQGTKDEERVFKSDTNGVREINDYEKSCLCTDNNVSFGSLAQSFEKQGTEVSAAKVIETLNHLEVSNHLEASNHLEKPNYPENSNHLQTLKNQKNSNHLEISNNSNISKLKHCTANTISNNIAGSKCLDSSKSLNPPIGTNNSVQLNENDNSNLLIKNNSFHLPMETNKKKKKKKKKSVLSTNGLHTNQHILEEVSELRSLLYDQSVSLQEGYPFIPSTNKQILTLKISLDSPGVIKMNCPDSVSPVINSLASDIYIGLVTLFLLLLQGSKWEITSQLTEIPFDVVSLFQVNLDGELMLVVGITENQNTKQKLKKNKHGTFFHAATHFLNVTDLEQILKKIWDKIEIERLKPSFSQTVIFQQLELQKKEKCEIPGTGKLSSFISISPDTNILNRILAMKSSLSIHTPDDSPSFSFFQYDSQIPEQELTCLTIQNILSMSPKHISAFLKTLRDNSVEIIGLRTGFIINDMKSHLMLSICINEVSSTTLQKGRMILANCEELKKINFNFHADHFLFNNNEDPIINFPVGSKMAFQLVVQWFGPHYKDHDEAFIAINEYKMVSSQIKDKKWSLETSSLSLLATCFSFSCLLVSSSVPTSFLAFIISFSERRGLQLKSMCKLCISLKEQHAWKIIPDLNNKTYSSVNEKHTLLVFYGRSCSYRLLGIVKKLCNILMKPTTGDSLQLLCTDKFFKYNELRKRCESYLLSHSTNDMIVPLYFNEHTDALLKTSELLPNPSSLVDFGDILFKARLNLYTPEVSLIALLVYGTSLVRQMSVFFRIVFGDLFFDCINAWRQASQCSSMKVLYAPTLEWLGLKYISKLSAIQVNDFIIYEPFSTKWKTETTKMIGKEANLVIFRAVDKREVTRLMAKLEDFMIELKSDKNHSDIILHSDAEYVTQIMYKYFNDHEIYGDSLANQSYNYYIPKDENLFSLSKMFNPNAEYSFVSLEYVSKLEFNKLYDFLPNCDKVYKVEFNKAPLLVQLVLQNEQSYVGFSVLYNTEHILAISKSLTRIVNMGFQICALKFPVFDHGDFWMRLVFKRSNAIFLLSKLLLELRSSYQSLVWSVTETEEDLICFIENNFKQNLNSGGIFYSNYFSYVHKLHFEGETIFYGRQSREIDWDPECSKTNNEFFMKCEPAYTQSFLSLPSTKTDQFTVIILTRPIMSGIFCGKRYPSKSVFPELWHLLESLSYRAVAMRMTSLSDEFANMIVESFGLDNKKAKLMKSFLMDKQHPILAVVMVGSCILSNFFITLQRNLDDEAIQCLKDFSLISQSTLQAEFLLLLLFDQVLPNSKFQIRTCVV